MTINFNDNWTFLREGKEPISVTLPHDAMITEPRRASCRNGVNSGYFPGGKYLYEKVFSVGEDMLGKSLALHFESIYQNAVVTVNDKEAARHLYGYTAFDADISDLVKLGENTVRVCVDNSLEPNCRWYSGSGIIRPVTLLVRDRNYIKTVHIETVSIDPAVLRVETDGDTIEIYDGETLCASGKPGEITVPNAKLWTAETPHLYTCVVRSSTDERRLDFGIRKLEWSTKNGLTVNGKEVLLRGGCIHHDHGVLGACEYRESEERRIRLLKENGFNAIRVAHNPASQILLETCDRLGMYVMNETFDGWYTPKTYHDYSRIFWDHWKEDITAMVESSRNHPCVVMYSIGNEVTETASEKGCKVCAEMRDYVHFLDPSRPVTAGINVLLNVYTNKGLGIYRDKGEYRPEPLPEANGYKEKKSGSAFFNALARQLGGLMFTMSSGKKGDKASRGAAEALDIIGLNYAASRYDEDAKNYPDRMMVGSETMAGDLPYNWERVKKYPQLIGDFVWSAWDYLGEACIGDWTYHSYKGLPLLAGQGMIDITGKPLAAMAFMQTVWGLHDKPYIGVRPLNHNHEKPSTGAWQFTNAIDSWTWQGYEGEKAIVEVYTNAARVRLSLNGREVSTKQVKNCKAIFRLPYTPGTLKAEALDDSGVVLSCSELTTGGKETVLCVRPEKDTAAPGEIVYVPVEFTDPSGEIKPYIEQRVEIQVEGGELLGFGSALCKTDEVFDKTFHDSYRGRTLAVLRAGKADKVTVTASSAGYATAAAEIRITSIDSV
ncbi:MAG: DUF4982 domain-containing protein [Oscillospiraceae bacterium]|nr:DUF4982 domain-containing protein [Oscillospiraceae bacterium]